MADFDVICELDEVAVSGGTEKFRVIELKKVRVIDIRRFIDIDRYSGPTKSGVVLPLADLDEVGKFFASAKKFKHANGRH
jgi:hypothetical protein